MVQEQILNINKIKETKKTKYIVRQYYLYEVKLNFFRNCYYQAETMNKSARKQDWLKLQRGKKNVFNTEQKKK